MNYYNEFDQNAAAWLRELIKMGAIPAGDVDERSISDVCSNDLKGYTQCHFFAGIGGWSLALQRAGIASDRPLWTGSCPCQDFSCAGKRKGVGSHRDLWPDFFRLIRECRPERVFGEQVEAAIGHGWLDRLSSDMEAEGYAVGSVVLGAHSAGADHQRQRLYWVADAQPCGRKPQPVRVPDGIQHEAIEQKKCVLPIGGCGASESRGLVNPVGERGGGGQSGRENAVDAGQSSQARNFWSDAIPHLCKDGKLRRFEPRVFKMVTGLSLRVGYGGDPRLPLESSLTHTNAGSSPSRLESHEQRSCEFDDFVCALSHAEALARVEGDNATLEALLSLRRACEKEGDVPKAFSTLEEIWRSLSDKEKHRVWMGFGEGRFLITHGVIASNGIFPLVAKRARGEKATGDPCLPSYANNTGEARVMRLKGYGNAICVDTAVMFIEECENIFCDANHEP